MNVVRTAMLLAAASPLWPIVKLLRPRFVISFPRAGAAFAAVVAGYLAALAVIAARVPSALPWIAAAALICNAALWIRGRAEYGSRSKLPPGSLEILPAGPWADPWHYTRLAGAYGPIFKASHFFHPMICLYDLESALRLLKEHDDVRLLSPKVAADRFLPCGFLRGMDPEKHRVHRKLVQSLITPGVIAAWSSSIESDVSEALREISGQRGGTYAKPAWDKTLRRSFARLFYGISPDTPEFRQLEQAHSVIARVADRRVSVPWLPSERHAEQVLEQTCDMLRRQTTPGCFLAELRRSEEFASSSQVLRLLLFMQYLGASDLAGLLQWAVKAACDFPAEIDRIRVAIGRGDPPETINGLCRRFTLELLRRHQVEHLYRRVLEDFEWEGYRIPKGWLLRICLSDAHRNPEVFGDPADFRPDRFLDNPPQSQFLPFGAFRRSCLGDGVTHQLMARFLCVFAAGWDVRQIGSSPLDYRGWHWTPGLGFKIELTPRRAS